MLQISDPGARISILDLVGAFGDLFKNPAIRAWGGMFTISTMMLLVLENMTFV
jgi:hypothetical protein